MEFDKAGLYPGRDLNPHDRFGSQDFKSCVSTDSTTRAKGVKKIPISLDRDHRAGNETRTRDPNLGKVMLYQLSYSRLFYFWDGKCITDIQSVKFFLNFYLSFLNSIENQSFQRSRKPLQYCFSPIHPPADPFPYASVHLPAVFLRHIPNH